MTDAKANSALLADIAKKGSEAHKPIADKESPALVQAKVQASISKGVKLEHVDGPKDGLTDAQKAAFLEDKKEKEAAKKS